MKYISRPSPVSYVLVPAIGALAGGVVLALLLSLVSAGEHYWGVRIGVCTLYVVFTIWYAWAQRYRDGVELDNGMITFIADARRKNAKSTTIPLSHIKLVEIVTLFPSHHKPSFYLLYGKDETIRYIDAELVPEPDIRRFCTNNQMPVADVIPTHYDTDMAGISKTHLKLTQINGKKELLIKIPATEIRTIELVKEHPFSETRKYYRITTADDKQFAFKAMSADVDELKYLMDTIGVTLTETLEYPQKTQ